MASGLRHGTWWDRTKGVPVEELMEGRFTRAFPDLPPARFADADLVALAKAMTADPDVPPTPENEVDAEENSATPAAFTYLGQFIDHDLTFDPVSHLHTTLSGAQLNALEDFRTPRFDLDNLYGRGPDDQPYLFREDGIHFQLGAKMFGNPNDPDAVDVPRGPSGRALIGDPRNDENRIVAQLHAAMLRFHNRVVDAMPGASFNEVRDAVRWHFQWVVVNDFLPTIIQEAVVREVFPHLGTNKSASVVRPVVRIPGLTDLKLMPVEFSVAAYRFGHSMIRPIYRINETIARRQIFSTTADPAGDLGGMRPIPVDWAVDWQFFLDLDHGAAPQVTTSADDPITRKPQHAYKIDTSLVNPLGQLPPVVASNPSSLAQRNLERGATFGLPSGQAVAEALGAKPLDGEHLLIGKATADPADTKTPLAKLIPAMANEAPLWTYILSEAQVTSLDLGAGSKDQDAIPIRLGPVGGRLVGEVFAALLLGDPGSVLNADPAFTPIAAFTHEGTFGLAELINVALGRHP